VGKASREKGKRGERAAANWFTGTLGWPAFRTAMQAHTRGDTPDVEAQSPAGVVAVEVKNTATLPGKTTLKAMEQAASYCKDGEVPLLWMHIADTSLDIVCGVCGCKCTTMWMAEKEALRRIPKGGDHGDGQESEA
jgi:hypothetical protein